VPHNVIWLSAESVIPSSIGEVVPALRKCMGDWMHMSAHSVARH